LQSGTGIVRREWVEQSLKQPIRVNLGNENPMGSSKIMVVDDDPDLRLALRLRLRASCYDTVQAGDGYSAIALAYKERPNLIILDLGLPAGDGLIVLGSLQRDEGLSAIPVIVLTARDRQGNEQRALNAGAVAFFQKPADCAELLEAIRGILLRATRVTAPPLRPFPMT
jgi:two-component system KDP operon response regulator KdpE